jgi:hypothetical protein
MKKNLVLVCICMTFFSAFSQKVDLDKTPFTIEYRDLPLNPLEVKKYEVVVEAPKDLRALIAEPLEDLISIEGLKKASLDEVRAKVVVTMKNLTVNKWKVEERIQVLTDNAGKETGKKSFFRVDVNYTCPGTVVIRNHQDDVVAENPIGVPNYLWSSPEFGTSKEATDYYSTNEGKIRMDLSAAQNKSNLVALSAWLTANFGYKPVKVSDLLWILDSKKHPEYQAQQDAFIKFKAAVAKVTVDQVPDDAKASLKEIIKYFDGIPARFATDEKNDKKMRYASFFNKGKIYLYLDETEAATKEADALIANGYDDGDGKKLKKDAEALAEQLKKNKTNTRHFVMDYSEASLPAAPVSWTERAQKHRVKMITDSRYDKAYGNKAFLVYQHEFRYGADGAMTAIKKSDKGQPMEGLQFAYSPNGVTIKTDKSKKVDRTLAFENSALKEYKSNSANTFSITREGARISSLIHDDRCNKITNVYQYAYDGSGKVSKLSVVRKELGPKVQEIYQVLYDAQGRVQNVNRTTPGGGEITNQWTLERTGDRVTKIHFLLGGKPWEREEFDYDENGNITEQRFIVIREEKEERLARVLTVSYEEAKGNDYILWDTNHWMYNSLMGIRSYIDIETPCY